MLKKKLVIYCVFVGFIFYQKTLAGTNDGTIGVYGSTDGNAGAVVRPTNNETYTNNGTIQGWRGLINIRSRSGTTTTNSQGAVIKFSGTGGWMPGGTNAETHTSTLNNTLENYVEFCKIVKPNMINIDYNTDPKRLLNDVDIPIQGGLDPKILLTDKSNLKNEVTKYLQIFNNHPYVFNLGHGILPETKIEMVEELVRIVREFK